MGKAQDEWKFRNPEAVKRANREWARKQRQAAPFPHTKCAGCEKPLALFLAKDNEKLWQAMHLQMAADYEIKQPVSIVALLESGSTGSQKMRDKASNRIAALTNWRGDEAAAINRILRELEVHPRNVH